MPWQGTTSPLRGGRKVIGAETQEKEGDAVPSFRDSKNLGPFQSSETQRIWCSPLYDWTSDDCFKLRQYAGIKPNIVCELIGMSGECLCGAFAKPGELEILRGWPETHSTYLRIKELEMRVREAGFPWGWADPIPDFWKSKKRGQESLFEPDS